MYHIDINIRKINKIIKLLAIIKKEMQIIKNVTTAWVAFKKSFKKVKFS